MLIESSVSMMKDRFYSWNRFLSTS